MIERSGGGHHCTQHDRGFDLDRRERNTSQARSCQTYENGIRLHRHMRAAIYARVSTTDQNCEMQLTELREHARARRWAVVSEYADTGVSGSKSSRPELNKLLKAAAARKFDVVLVWKLDRWGRSTADCLSTIRDLTDVGIRFIAVTQGIDTDSNNAMGRFFTTILAAVAELERELIRERVVAGMKQARADGKALGRPRRVFDRAKAMRLRESGLSWRRIAKELKVPFMTVRDACTDMPPSEYRSPR